MTAAESALVVLVPEAEPLIGPYRARHDPSAALGVPAHITILYPFRPPPAISDDVLSALQGLFAGQAAFTIALIELRRFPEVLYLAPVPAASLIAMIDRVAQAYPDTPPYGGVFDEVIPHLTVAQTEDGELLDRLTGDVGRALAGRLPIHTRVAAVALMDDADGRWRVRHQFRLAEPA